MFQVFFAVLIGAFALGQAGPNMEALFTAAGAAGTIFETIDRVSGSITDYYHCSGCMHRIVSVESMFFAIAFQHFLLSVSGETTPNGGKNS